MKERDMFKVARDAILAHEKGQPLPVGVFVSMEGFPCMTDGHSRLAFYRVDVRGRPLGGCLKCFQDGIKAADPWNDPTGMPRTGHDYKLPGWAKRGERWPDKPLAKYNTFMGCDPEEDRKWFYGSVDWRLER